MGFWLGILTGVILMFYSISSGVYIRANGYECIAVKPLSNSKGQS